jgi:hypothetical protein
MLNLEILQFTNYKPLASVDIYLEQVNLDPSDVEPVLRRNLEGIKDFFYLSTPVYHYHSGTEIASASKKEFTKPEFFQGVTPSPILQQVIEPDIYNTTSGLNLAS